MSDNTPNLEGYMAVLRGHGDMERFYRRLWIKPCVTILLASLVMVAFTFYYLGLSIYCIPILLLVFLYVAQALQMRSEMMQHANREHDRRESLRRHMLAAIPNMPDVIRHELEGLEGKST